MDRHTPEPDATTSVSWETPVRSRDRVCGPFAAELDVIDQQAPAPPGWASILNLTSLVFTSTLVWDLSVSRDTVPIFTQFPWNTFLTLFSCIPHCEFLLTSQKWVKTINTFPCQSTFSKIPLEKASMRNGLTVAFHCHQTKLLSFICFLQRTQIALLERFVVINNRR